MRANNIKMEDLLKVLLALHKRGVEFIDMELLPDDDSPEKNKMIIYPVHLKKDNKTAHYEKGLKKLPAPKPEDEIKDPEISRDNDDIFNYFNL